MSVLPGCAKPYPGLRGFRSLALALCALFLLGCTPEPGSANEATATKPAAKESELSLLLVTLDTTRPDHLEPYGAAGVETPVLARLAAEGIVFERAYATTPVTLPSHASILTGLYPPGHGLRNNAIHTLSNEAVTLAEILRSAGFRTAAVVSTSVLDRRYGLDQGFEVYDDDMASGKPRQLRLNAERRAGDTVNAARGWLDGLAPGSRFLLWVHLFDPHADYAAPEPWGERFRDRPYDGEIAYLDAELGRLLAHPRIAGPCLTMVVGDHGEGLGDHGESTHAMLAYDSTLRIPWLVRRPGGRPGRVSHPVSQVDLLPTALDLLGLEHPWDEGGIAGRSQAPAIIGGPSSRGSSPPGSSERPIYAETLVPLYTYGWAELHSVVVGRWKLIDAPGVRPPGAELYDLEADPGELRNLAGDQPERLAELRRVLGHLGVRPTGEPAVGPSPAVAPDRSMRRKLESLGYLASRSAGSSDAEAGERPDPKSMIALHEAVERGQHLLQRRDLAGAVRELQPVLRRDPDNLAALVNLAKARAAQGRFDEGIELARRALELAPGDPELHTALGLLESARGNQEAALAAYDQALSIDPKWLDARIEKARCLYRLGRRQEAGALAGLLLAEDPDVARVQVAQAVLVELPARRLDAAAERLRRAAAQEPSLVEAWRALGRVLEAGGDLPAAAAAYRDGLEQQPDDGTLHARLGLVLSRQRLDPEAEVHLRRAVERVAEGSPPVLSALSAIHLRRREWAAAEAEARRALALDPRFVGAWTHLAIALEEEGKVDEALSAYGRAREIAPEDWQAEFNKALLLRKSGRFAEAAESQRWVLERAGNHDGAHFELGILYAGPLGDPALARVHLRASLDAAPDHPRASQVREILRQLGGG